MNIPETLIIKNNRPSAWYHMSETGVVVERDRGSLRDGALLRETFASRTKKLTEKPTAVSAVFIDYTEIKRNVPLVRCGSESL